MIDCQDCSLDPICHTAFTAGSPFGNTDFNYVLDNMDRRTDIAAYLGLRHETLSRSLGQFQQQGLILLKGKQIHILRHPQLIALASGHDISA